MQTYTPRLVTHRSMVITARAPTKQVNPAAIGRRNVAVSIANIVVLVLSKLPSVGRSLVLQVAL